MMARLAFLGLAMSLQAWGQAPTQWIRFDEISAPFHDLLSDGDRMLAVGSEGLIAISGDGVGWTRIPLGTQASLSGILRIGTGMAYGDSGLVLTSPDGGNYFEARTGAWLALPVARTGAIPVVRLRNLQGRVSRNLVVTGLRGHGVSLQGVPPGLYLLDIPRAAGASAAILRVDP